ncbi:4361_t:CDS:2 [Ambispora leptoticha]|uniref:4361_t:CDS:1 n=1 Tax=Ambispora leptoticha TaxID=144679 RepID=A0A9N9IWL4_9GLOM|nr:4361_t:CDS:2 [Ambispora leptoticha]
MLPRGMAGMDVNSLMRQMNMMKQMGLGGGFPGIGGGGGRR